jgi:hypothetical protein
MIAYFVLGIIILFFTIITSYTEKDKYGLFFSFVLIFLFLGFRFNYGNDYTGYHLIYNKINGFVGSTLDSHDRFEIGWIILNRIFKPFGFYSMVFCLAFFNCIAYYLFIKKFVAKKYYWFATLIYYFNSYFFLIQLSAMRQCLAILLFIFSLDFLTRKKYLISGALILLAISFHYSALFLVPVIILAYAFTFKLKFIHIVIVETIYILFFVLGAIFKPLLLSISTYLFGDKYSYYLGFGTSPGLINILIYSILLLIILYHYNSFNYNFQLFAKLFIVGLFLLPVGYILPISSRMALYFLPLSIIIYPRLLSQTESLVLRQIFIISVISVFAMRLFTFLSMNWLYYYHYRTIFSTLSQK